MHGRWSLETAQCLTTTMQDFHTSLSARPGLRSGSNDQHTKTCCQYHWFSVNQHATWTSTQYQTVTYFYTQRQAFRMRRGQSCTQRHVSQYQPVAIDTQKHVLRMKHWQICALTKACVQDHQTVAISAHNSNSINSDSRHAKWQQWQLAHTTATTSTVTVDTQSDNSDN